MELSQCYANRLPGDGSCPRRLNCCLSIPTSVARPVLLGQLQSFHPVCFSCRSVDSFCWFGFVGPDTEAEGNVFCLASNPHCVSPPRSSVYSTKNLGKENKFESQSWFHLDAVFFVFIFFFFFPLVFFKHLCFQRRIIISAARHFCHFGTIDSFPRSCSGLAKQTWRGTFQPSLSLPHCGKEDTA